MLGEIKSHRTVKTSSRALLLSNKRSILQLKTAGKPPAKLCWTASQFIAIVSFSCLYLQIFVNDQQLIRQQKRGLVGPEDQRVCGLNFDFVSYFYSNMEIILVFLEIVLLIQVVINI